MKTKVFLLIFYCLFSPPQFLHAQQSQEIIISADRLKSSPLQTSSQVVLFDSKEISKHASLTSLLENQSDLSFITSGPSGGTTSLFLRGNDSSHLLVIIDGIIMNDPSTPNRQFDLGRLSLTSIKKIELLKGSQGMLYGSNAIGGVLLITTKEEAAHSLKTSFDSFHKNQYEAFSSKKFGKTLINLSLDHLKTKGFSAANDKMVSGPDDDGQKRTTLQSKIKHQLTSQLYTELIYRLVHDFTEIDKGGGNNSDDPNDYQTNQEQYGKIGFSFLNDKSESHLGFMVTNHKRLNSSLNDRTYQEESKTRTEGTLLHYYFNHSYSLFENLEQNIFLDYQQESDLLKNKNHNSSLGLYHHFDLSEGRLNFGVRIDYNKYFKEYFTYKLAFNQNWFGLTWRGSYSNGLRSPSLNQLFDPSYGNKFLLPETSQNLEIGPEYPLSPHTNLRLSLFATEIKNRLSYHPVSFININLGQSRNYGSEITLNHQTQLIGDLELSSTLLKTEDLRTRQKLPRRPNVNSRINHSYTFKEHWTVSNLFKYVGRRDDVDNNGLKVKMPGYGILNTKLSYTYKERLNLYLSANNLLNKKYEDVYGYNSPKRNAELSIEYLF